MEQTSALPRKGDPAPDRLERLAALLERAVAEREVPGAVALVAWHGETVFHRAFGCAQLIPTREPMLPETLFDLASLTKVVATAPALLCLVEDGALRLQDRVAQYLPEFQGEGKEGVDLRHLLTHCAGLPSWQPFYEIAGTPEDRLAAVCAAPLEHPVGCHFQYSDLGFILLGEVARRVSGMPLDAFCRRRLYEPLGMRDTLFCPPADWAPRCAATEVHDGVPLRGTVHDENAASLGGVAGHAGLFSTAADLARFCRMLLNAGELDGARVLSPLSVRAMLSPQSPCAGSARGLGFDLNSAYASIRGDLLPTGSAGHSGFTGTSLWIDADLGLCLLLLTNAVHPERNRPATRLRSRVSNVVAASLGIGSGAPPDESGGAYRAYTTNRPYTTYSGSLREPVQVLAGADLLRQDGCRRLSGARVGLITNHTGRCAGGGSTLEMLLEAGVAVQAIFTPEHGFAGRLDEDVPSSCHEATGLPLHSLYGDIRRPLPEWLAGLDTLVFDIQDIGARFYTYITTMGFCLEEAAKHRLRFVVLDRPNPITGLHVEGPLMDLRFQNFAGHYPLPVRHGMTVGELARLFSAEFGCGGEVEVVPALGWRRGMWWDQTGLEWVNPSPAMRSLNAAMLYPGLCCLENSNLSMGRGTDRPFEMIGAPWLDARRVAAELNARDLPGIAFVPAHFTPEIRVYQGERCGALHCLITDREAFRPVAMAVHIAEALHRIHTAEFTFDAMPTLIGTDRVPNLLHQFAPAEAIIAEWEEDEARFAEQRAPYLLYQ